MGYRLDYQSNAAGLQEDDNYEQGSDVRAQLKFFEHLDQLEKQRKEEQEREILLKAAKVQCPQMMLKKGFLDPCSSYSINSDYTQPVSGVLAGSKPALDFGF